MITSIGKHWWAYSKRNKKFDAVGYTKPGGNHTEDAIEAMKVISRYVKEPIPMDIRLDIIGSDQ